MKKKISTLGTFWDFSPGLWVGVFETRYLGEFMGDLGRIYIGRKRRLRAFFLSWLSLRVLLPATMPIESFCRYRRRCQKKKLYIAQKKTREKRPFCFFWSLRPRKPSNTSKYTSNCSGEREAGRLAAVFHKPGNSWPPGRRSQRLDGAGKRCGQKLQGQVAQSALLAEVRCSTAARRFKR